MSYTLLGILFVQVCVRYSLEKAFRETGNLILKALFILKKLYLTISRAKLESSFLKLSFNLTNTSF